VSGSLGETSALLLLLGGIFLIAVKYVDWRVPVSFLVTVFVLSLILPYKGAGQGMGFVGLGWRDAYWKAIYHLLSGGLIIGAFFMATDMVTSPLTRRGLLIFGAGCGLLTALIRHLGGYPEGVCYAILIMNTAVPIIDRYTKPTIFGFVPKKE
jgi:electron transport complex protein RnfD